MGHCLIATLRPWDITRHSADLLMKKPSSKEEIKVGKFISLENKDQFVLEALRPYILIGLEPWILSRVEYEKPRSSYAALWAIGRLTLVQLNNES